jgi:hypothetical protein
MTGALARLFRAPVPHGTGLSTQLLFLWSGGRQPTS